MNETVENAESTGSFDVGLNLTNRIVTCSESNDIKVSEIPQCDGEKQPSIEQIRENDGIDIEAEHTLFKVPLKRRQSDNTCDLRPVKRTDVGECEDQADTESGSESDCSLSLSQTECVSRNYEMEDIKLFLKATKNRRGVRVSEYFPDLKQFIEKTRCLMAEGFFTNKEMYRLKKVVRKLNTEINNDNRWFVFAVLLFILYG